MVKKFRSAASKARVVVALSAALTIGGVALDARSASAQETPSTTQAAAAPAQAAAPAPVTAPEYKKIGVNAGVYNGGQAALWDLNMIDYLWWFGATARARGYRPEQPINFSHETHVAKNKIECQFCHWSVAKSSYAAIPEVETCLGCHRQALGPKRLIEGTTDEQKAEISKIDQYATKPVPWVKVHVMPDYVKFNHKRHVKAGVSCQECHGQVPEMEVVERVSSMKMGWCVNCHRERGTSIDCMTCHGHR